jgi:hypothetical protein
MPNIMKGSYIQSQGIRKTLQIWTGIVSVSLSWKRIDFNCLNVTLT